MPSTKYSPVVTRKRKQVADNGAEADTEATAYSAPSVEQKPTKSSRVHPLNQRRQKPDKAKRKSHKRPPSNNVVDVRPNEFVHNGRISPSQRRDTNTTAQKADSCLSISPKHEMHVTNGRTSTEGDLFTRILQSKMQTVSASRRDAKVKDTTALTQISKSMVHFLQKTSHGMKCSFRLRQSVPECISNLVGNMELRRTASPFKQRCTAMEWHPNISSLLAVGSKSGDVILWDTNSVGKDLFIQGRGPGVSVSAMKFHPTDPTKIYTATLDGKITLQDMLGQHSQILMDLMSWSVWYCSLDLSMQNKLIVTGDNVGKLTTLTLEGEKVSELKLHKQKITHAEFSRREPWLLCTASVDHTVKLWDIRMLRDKGSFLMAMDHDKAVNSAYFSLSDGCRLLTTDQHSDLRVYSAVTGRLEQSIAHPHRQFQHLTPIKACWHPLQDLIMVGRYPDPGFPGFTKSERRTIDGFSADTGHMVCQLYDASAAGIVSLNKFSYQGDVLASTMGVNILLWKQGEDASEMQAKLMQSLRDRGLDPTSSSATRRTKQANEKKNDKKKQTTDKSAKLDKLRLKKKMNNEKNNT